MEDIMYFNADSARELSESTYYKKLEVILILICLRNFLMNLKNKIWQLYITSK